MNDHEADVAKEAVRVQDVKDEKRTRWAIRERWAYVILAIFLVAMCVLTAGFVINYTNANNHAWCDIIHASLPVTAPAKPGPNATAQAVKFYHDYQLVVTLGRRFGCF